MRNTFDVMQDLDKVWGTLSNSEKTAIAQQAAGKNQFEVFTAVMNNFKNAIKATDTAYNSAGSAAKENAKAMDSIEGRLQKLRSAFEYFAYKTINSDWIKSITDAGTALLEFLGSDMGQSTMKFTAIAAGVLGLARAFSKLSGVVKGLSAMDAFKTLIMGSKSVQGATKEAAKATAQYTAAEAASTAVFTNGYKVKVQGAKAVGKTTAEVGKAAKKTGVLSKAWTGLTGIITAHPFIAAAAGVAATTYAVTKFVDKYNETYELFDKTNEKIKENNKEIETLRKKTENLTKTEQDRLVTLQSNNKALEKQTKEEAKAALEKATKPYIGKDGQAKGRTGVGKAGVQRTGVDKLQRDAELISNYQKQLQKYNKELEANNIELPEWQKQYKGVANQIYDVVDSYDKQIKAFEDAEKAGIPLTEIQQEIWTQLKQMRDGAKEVHESYQEIKTDEELLAQAEDWIPNASEIKPGTAAMATLRDRINDLSLAMNRTGDDGQKAFKHIMDGVEGGYKELGKFNKETGKIEFSNTNIEDYAKKLNVTEEAAQALLKTQTKSGKIKWKVPDEDLSKFEQKAQKLDNTLQKTDGSMVYSKKSLTDLAKSMNIPDAAIGSFIKSIQKSGAEVVNLNQKTPQLVDKISKLGDTFGITSEKGKGITEVNLDSVVGGLKDMGATEDKVAAVVQYLSGIEGVKLTGNYSDFINGANEADYAARQLYNGVKEVDGVEAEPKIKQPDGVKNLEQGLTGLLDDFGVLDHTKAEPQVSEKGSKKTQKEVKKTKKDVEDLDNTEGKAKLEAENNTQQGVSSAEGTVGSFDGTSWSAWLEALNQTQPGMGSAIVLLSAFAGMPFIATLTSQDNATPTVDGAESAASSFATNYAASLSAKDGASGTINYINGLLNSLNGKTAVTYVETVETTEKKATGKRKGEAGGMAWVGDEGDSTNPKPELIETKDGAYLAGTKGWELVNLGQDDIVHTASETRRLLAGKFKGMVDSGFLPKFAKGKKGKKKKKSFGDKVDDVRDAFDKAVDTLEYQRDYYNWSDDTFNKKYNALYNKYQKKARKIKKGKKRGSLSTEQRRDVRMASRETSMEKARDTIEAGIESIAAYATDKNVAAAIANIDKVRKAQKISAKEASEYKKEVYKAAAEYNLKEYENGNKTYAQMKKAVDAYYKHISKTSAEYYEMQENLANAAKEKELDRLDKLKEAEDKKQELAELYVQKQIDTIDKQIEAQEKLNEKKEEENELAELEAQLAKAKTERVRIFRNGQFEYEYDADAIKDAQKALDDFHADDSIKELEKTKEAWQAIEDLLGDLSTEAQIKGLENDLGMTAGSLFGQLGTDPKKWTTKIKDILSKSMGYEDLADLLESKEGYAEIMKLIDPKTGKIDQAKFTAYINKNKFANGTNNAPNGISLVGEQGAELRFLNKGDSIVPNNVSANLMALGQFNPSQWETIMARNVAKKTNNQTPNCYNFDKLVLPNVQNANDFMRELQQLPNKAIQSQGRRS